MSTFGLLLVLTAAVCHAIWNFQVKRINAGPELVWLFSVVSMLLYFPLALFAFLRAGTLSATDYGVIFVSVILHLAYFLLLQAGYRRGDLSVVYPTARATGPLVSTALAVSFLGAPMSPQIAAGAMAIIAGVFFLTGGENRRSAQGSSLLFGLCTGLLIGSYTAWDAWAVATLMIAPMLVDYASSIGRVVLLSPIAWRRRQDVRRLWRDHRGGVLIIAVFGPLAYLLVLIAMQFTPVVYVAPLREVSVLISVVLGSVLLNEGHLGKRLWWALIILGGVLTLVTA